MKLTVLTILTLALFSIPALAQKPAGAGMSQQPAAHQRTSRQQPEQQVSETAQKPCLIVTSAEGHRFRNSMIAGALTGGIGFVAGLGFSGGRYEYRDSINVPPSEVKMKYKGGQLQKLQKQGIHIVVVDKKDKTGTEIKEAHASCEE